MTRTLSRERRVEGDGEGLAARLAGDPERWLPLPLRRSGLERWIVTLQVGMVVQDASCRVGPPWSHGEGSWRSLSWQPLAEDAHLVPVERFLPELEGELRWSVMEDGVIMGLDGRYSPPGGRVGRAADAAVLHRLGQATFDRFLDGIAERLAS